MCPIWPISCFVAQSTHKHHTTLASKTAPSHPRAATTSSVRAKHHQPRATSIPSCSTPAPPPPPHPLPGVAAAVDSRRAWRHHRSSGFLLPDTAAGAGSRAAAARSVLPQATVVFTDELPSDLKPPPPDYLLPAAVTVASPYTRFQGEKP
jgi:hypothetical protein